MGNKSKNIAILCTLIITLLVTFGSTMSTNTSLKKLHHPKTSLPIVQQANTDGNTITGNKEDWNVEDSE